MVAIEDHEPAAEHQKAAREGDEMRGIEQVEHAAGNRQHRKSADPARTPQVGAGKEILESEAEKLNASSSAALVTEGAEIMGSTNNLAVARWASVSYIALGRDLARRG